MPIVMIDNDLAEWVTQQLTVGERYNFITGPNNRSFNFELVEIKLYSVIVKGAYGQRLELSIAKSELYITAMKEKQPMSNTTRMPLPAEAKVAKRGRPTAKTATAAPAKPSNPPNPFAQALAPAAAAPAPVNNGGFGFTAPSMPATKPPQEMPIARAEGSDVWFDKAIDEATANFAADMKVICKNIYVAAEANDNNGEEEKQHTCLQCVFINLAENKCDKFNMTPPLYVIAKAKEQCTAYLEDEDQIPFGT